MKTIIEPCPCGSGQSSSSCCLRVMNNHSKARNPEMLMRSRYTAYAKQNSQYLLASWHKSTRPKSLDLYSSPVVWLKLIILDAGNDQFNDNSGLVRFRCYYLEKGQLCILEESSNFVKEEGLWFYLDGECQVTKEKPVRNSDCPCGSGKKFKRCCLMK